MRSLMIGMVACLAACTHSAKSRAFSAAGGSDFWPEAPKPTAPAGPRTLVYQPDHLKAFENRQRLEISVGDSESMTSVVTTLMRFGGGTTAGSRELFVDEMTTEASMGGHKATFRVDRNGMTIDMGHGAKTYKRGDVAPIDFATLIDKPMFTFAFNDNRVTATSPDPAWKNVNNGASSDDVTNLFPDLPGQPITAGFKWTKSKQVRLPNNMGEFVVAYELEYAGDSACPSTPSKTCAQILVRGHSNEAPFQVSGVKSTMSYASAGKIFFDVDQGVLDESRIQTAANLESGDQHVEIDMTTSIKPLELPNAAG